MLLRQLLLIIGLGAGAAILCGAGSILTPVSLQSHSDDGVDEIKAQFYVNATPQTAWEVLTDYQQIPKFVSGMEKSQVIKQDGDDLLLNQEAVAGFLFITKTIDVLLKVHETPDTQISFQDVGHKDFWFYQGSWHINPCPQGGVSVIYHLIAEKNFDAPFAGDYMNGGVKNLLTAVQKEIYERQVQADNEKTTAVAINQNTVYPTPSPEGSAVKAN